MFIWCKRAGNLFLRQHDNNETYKAYKETFLMEGLRRYVCNNIKSVAGLPIGRPAFLSYYL